MDAEATKSDFSIPSTVCAGHVATGANIYVKNNFVDTIYNFYVAYSINGKATRQLVKSRILPGNTLKVDFTSPIMLSIAGNTTIKIYLDIPDDNTKNDTLHSQLRLNQPQVEGFMSSLPKPLRQIPRCISVEDLSM
jgi:hypothetical protein